MCPVAFARKSCAWIVPALTIQILVGHRERIKQCKTEASCEQNGNPDPMFGNSGGESLAPTVSANIAECRSALSMSSRRRGGPSTDHRTGPRDQPQRLKNETQDPHDFRVGGSLSAA